MKTCAFIYNPESGKNNVNQNKNKISSLLNKYNYSVIWKPTQYKAHAIEIMNTLPNVDLVISCGGDGTLNEIISGNIKRKKRLLIGHLPTGTTNDVGSMYGYTGRILYDLECLLNGEIKTIDICMINSQPFIYVACIGPLVDIAYNTPRNLKRKLGKLGYILKGISELKNDIKKYNIKYTINNKTYETNCSFIFISNANSIAGFKNIYKDIKLNDNKFEVAIIEYMKKPKLMTTMSYLLFKDIHKIKKIHCYKTDELDIEFNDTFKDNWCIDGEEYKQNKKRFHIVIDRNTKMLLPKKNIKKLFK